MIKAIILTLTIFCFTITNTLGQCRSLIKNIEVRHNTCFGGNIGSSVIYTTTDAALPCIFLLKDSIGRQIWSPAGSSIFNSLYANRYLVQVTDARGCTDSATFTITQPLPLKFDFVQLQCDSGIGNGSGKLVNRQTGKSHIYTWANGDSIIKNLKAGTIYRYTITDANACSVTDSYTVSHCLTDIKEVEQSLQIYPNPFTHTLNIESKILMDNIEVYDNLGRKVIVCSVKDTDMILPLSSLERGLYFIKIFVHNGVLERKILKE